MADTPAPQPSASSSSETVVWRGTTSQWVHWQYYGLCILGAAGIIALHYYTKWFSAGFTGLSLLIPLIAAAVRFGVTRCTRYELTTERILKSTGVLNRRKDNLELYRVRDYTILEPFFLRILGLGNLKLITSDADNPELTIDAVPGIETLREQLRKAVEAARDRKRVRQMDVDSVDGDSSGMGDLGHHG